MATPAIRVDGLGKMYRLAHGDDRAYYRTLRDSLTSFIAKPFKKRGTVEEFWALNDVSFEVQPGEVVGLIGRNGAGKSTLLKILSRITKPTKGRVEINGRVGSLLEVGTGFHPELTGRENVFLNGSILGMSRNEIAKKFDEIVAFAEVEKFLDTPVKRYSSGMYVRLAFAVAAHLEPEILIVDEVLAVGDNAFQTKCLGKMRSIASNGVTVLLVSHQLDTVLRLCTKVAILRAGSVVGVMNPTEAIDLYSSEAAKQSQRGGGAVGEFVRSVTVTNEDRDSGVLQCGQSVIFTLQLQNLSPAARSLVCGIVITDRSGTRVVAFHTGYHSNMEINPSANLQLTCEVPSLPLVPGQYFVDVILANDGAVIERIERAAILDVVFRDHLGTGRLPFAGQGYFAIPCNWSQQ